MMKKYLDTISRVQKEDGSLLDAMLATQEIDGCLTEDAIWAIGEAFGLAVTQVYETASFYSMIRFAPVGKTVIQVCRNAPCHVAGAQETIAALEDALGVSMGDTSTDGKYTLEYTECIGQCQASPSVLVNSKVHSNVTADKVPELMKALEKGE